VSQNFVIDSMLLLPNYLRDFCITFNHPEDGGSTFIRNARINFCYSVQKSMKYHIWNKKKKELLKS